MTFWKQKSNHKYGARRTNCLAKKHPHPSALEAAVCDYLSAREQSKEISDVKWQSSVDLDYGIRWKVDFSFDENGERVWWEAKGEEDASYKLKYRMWKEGAGPGRLHIIKGDYKRFKCVETVIPKKGKTMTMQFICSTCGHDCGDFMNGFIYGDGKIQSCEYCPPMCSISKDIPSTTDPILNQAEQEAEQ